jgi:putative ABC transport system permease protein
MNFFTELREGLAISWGAIRANKMRSILTTLGIVIGVVTVTLMGTAIEGLNLAFVKSVSFIGADVFYVERTDWFIKSREDWIKMSKRPRLTLAQASALAREMTLARAIAPTAESSLPVKYGRSDAQNATVTGTTDQFLLTSGVTVAEGRFLSPAECSGGRPVCVIGSQIASNYFKGISPLGLPLTIGGRHFEVVGVLEKLGGFLDSGVDNQVIIPLPLFTTAFLPEPDYGIQVKVGNLDQVEDAKDELRILMRRIRRDAPTAPDDFSINQQDQVLTLFHTVAGSIEAIGLFVTGLSLFVGGIGIMNIMFVSVAERTREIGIRKAIGARRRTIMVQFLIEAISICLIGGVLALALAWPLTLLMQQFLPATLSPFVAGMALAVATLTGVVSGFFPAWRAACMNPVDALRNE